MQWSKSKLKTFRECPMKFKFNYIERIPIEQKAEALYKGIILHDVYEKFYEEYNGDNFNEAIFNTANKLNVPEEFQIKYEKHVNHFKDLNDNFNDLKNPLLKEKKYYFEDWTGIIDRVDKFEDKIYIFDYKTSSGKNIGNYKDELLLYAKLINESTKYNVQGIGIIYTGNGIVAREEITKKEIEDNYQNLQMEKELYKEKIQKNEYEYNPGFWCKWCPYHKICEIKTGYKK